MENFDTGMHVRLDDAMSFLGGLCGDMQAEYPALEYTILDPDDSGSRVITYGNGSYGVRVGIEDLEAGSVGGMARDQDLAWAAKSLFHERRHLWQKEKLFKSSEELSGKGLDMAVMEACAMAYTGYNDGTYSRRLSETDADREGIKDAVTALSGKFPGTDWEKAMVQAVNERDQAFDDARSQGIFGPVKASRSRAWQEGRRYENLGEVYARFDELDRECLPAKRPEPCREFCEHDDAICEDNAWDEKFFRLLDGDGIKTGPERDREILASVLQARVFDVGRYFPAMSGTLDAIKTRYGVDTDAVHKVRRLAAVPSDPENPAYGKEM